MKNSMKTIGVLSLALMAFGALFKIMHWPFAGIMLAISFLFLIVVFFPSLLYVIYRDVNEKKEAGIYILAFISGSMFSAGVLFKIMHWPFTNFLFFPGLALITYALIPLIIIKRFKKLKMNKAVFLVGLISLMVILTGLMFKIQHWPFAAIFFDIGAILMVLVFVPMFYVSEVKKSENLRLDFLFGMIVIVYFLIFTFLISLSGNENLNTLFNSQVKSYVTNATYFEQQNAELKKSTLGAMDLINQADLLDREIEEIEIQIVQHYYTVNKDDALIIMQGPEGVDEIQANVNFLLSEYNVNSPLPKLKSDIEHFNKLYNTIMNDSLKLNLALNQVLNTDKKFPKAENQSRSWEISNFFNCSPAAAINTLSFWQYNIRLVENRVLSSLIHNQKN